MMLHREYKASIYNKTELKDLQTVQHFQPLCNPFIHSYSVDPKLSKSKMQLNQVIGFGLDLPNISSRLASTTL